MPIYTCKRCNYETKHKGTFKRHLLRKKVCESINSDISILEIALSYENKFGDILEQLENNTKIPSFYHHNTTNLPPQNHHKTINISDSLNCRYCNKIFANTKGKYRHEKHFCKVKKELDEQKSITINNINNGTINNILHFGSEELYNILTYKQKLKILKSKNRSIYEMIRIGHCNKEYPQLQNIKIKNLEGKYAHIYDANEEKFIVREKEVALREFVDNKYHELSVFFDEYEHKLKERDREIILKLMDDQSDDDHKWIYNLNQANILIYNFFKSND